MTKKSAVSASGVVRQAHRLQAQRDFQGVPDDGSVLTKHGQVHLLRWHSLRASPLLADAIQVTRATADPCSGL